MIPIFITQTKIFQGKEEGRPNRQFSFRITASYWLPVCSQSSMHVSFFKKFSRHLNPMIVSVEANNILSLYNRKMWVGRSSISSHITCIECNEPQMVLTMHYTKEWVSYELKAKSIDERIFIKWVFSLFVPHSIFAMDFFFMLRSISAFDENVCLQCTIFLTYI